MDMGVIEMNDDKHVDRYVRITNRERFLIARGLSFLADACYIGDGCVLPQLKELIALGQVFREENWKKEYPIRYANKVKAVEEKDDEREEM